MKAFNRFFAAVIAAVLLLFAVANGILLRDKADNDRPYLVEVNRLSRKIQADTFEPSDLTACDYVTAVSGYSENFYNSPSDYVVREINGELYRFDYHTDRSAEKAKQMLIVNAILAGMSVLIVSVLFYTKRNILAPFNQLKDVPYALSKGNLTVPMKESKSRFFGNFLWGLDLLRENLEQQKERELELQRDRKMLLLSLSHDIKTPLSAIKLYAKALSRGLYTDKEKQLEVAESIHAKANEIEHYVTQIVTASREDFLTFDVTMGE